MGHGRTGCALGASSASTISEAHAFDPAFGDTSTRSMRPVFWDTLIGTALIGTAVGQNAESVAVIESVSWRTGAGGLAGTRWRVL